MHAASGGFAASAGAQGLVLADVVEGAVAVFAVDQTVAVVVEPVTAARLQADALFVFAVDQAIAVIVDDVVAAPALCLTHPGAAYRSFNVGGGVPVTVMEVAQTLARLFGANVPIEISGNFRLGDIRHNYADMTRIREALGFEPAWSFERGIAELVLWAKGSGPQASAYEASLDEMRAKGLLQ